MTNEGLSVNSEQLLLALVQSNNPTQALCDQLNRATPKEKSKLRSIIRELQKLGYLSVTWASNSPYHVSLTNSAQNYHQRPAKGENKTVQLAQNGNARPIIFISHRSTDKAVADMLVDFFSGTGISRDAVFCSSLPGNDVRENISREIKAALKDSVVNIAILSQDYYQSAYCLNEAGILWYLDRVPVIPIALPEIDSGNMYGFLDNEYKLRRLDSEDDVAYIYDTVKDAVAAPTVKTSITTRENQKVRERYNGFLKTREAPVPSTQPSSLALSEITTDDERIILYYILEQKVRKVSKDTFREWLHKREIHEVNIDNGFDLLSSIGSGKVTGDTLELGIEAFRKYSSEADALIPVLKPYVDSHIRLASDTFKNLWDSAALDAMEKLFVAYVIEERVYAFGDRWMAEGEIDSIKKWEGKNSLTSELAENYGHCLAFFVQNNLVYESEWTSYGNPRKYSLYSSLRNYFFDDPVEIIDELNQVKSKYYLELPF